MSLYLPSALSELHHDSVTVTNNFDSNPGDARRIPYASASSITITYATFRNNSLHNVTTQGGAVSIGVISDDNEQDIDERTSTNSSKGGEGIRRLSFGGLCIHLCY